jgi:ketosteroid isomerase-like protein
MLVCPQCNIEYDEGKKYCKKCGSFLLSEEGSTFEIPLVELTELKKPEENLFCPTCQTSYKKGKYCRKCGSLLAHGIPSQTPTIRSIQESSSQKFSKGRVKSSFRPFPVLSAVAIIVLIVSGGLFLWQRHNQTIQPTTLAPQNPTPSNEIEENKKIESLFEKIKEANLNKNIDLFMSCYSIDFKDRGKKEIDTLESWKKFNYLDLTYHLKERTISGHLADVRVEWEMKIDQKGGKQPEDIKTTLDVVLKKEGDFWKIIETKPGT